MTVTPGSLDYLYYNGILPCIPYEAYSIQPATQSGIMEMSGASAMPSLGNIKQSTLGGAGMAQVSPYSDMNTLQPENYINSSTKGNIYGSYGSFNDYSFNSANSSYVQDTNNASASQMYGGSYGYGIAGYNAPNPSISAEYNVPPQNYGYSNDNVAITRNFDRMSDEEDISNFHNSLTKEAEETKKGVLNSNSTVKGLISAALIIATPILICKRIFKRPAKSVSHTGSNFWSKLNPKNWFKK